MNLTMGKEILMMNRTAVITGAASGIGLDFSYLLAGDSYNLILVDVDDKRLREVSNLFRSQYENHIEIITCDLSGSGAAMKIYNAVRGCEIDVLINNAGFGLYGFFSETDWQHEEKMIHLHVITLSHLTKLVLTDMLKRSRGKILNVASIAGFFPGPYMSIYFATKAYIISFTKALVAEVKGKSVTVTAFCPGKTRTRFAESISSLSNCPLNRIHSFSSDSREIAKYGYKAMNAGKIVAIPGVINKLVTELPRALPSSVILSLIKTLQIKSRYKNRKASITV